MKYTFLSKWTVLILTVVTIVLAYLGSAVAAGNLFGNTFEANALVGVLLYLIAFVVYAVAWIIAFADSIQEHRWLWTIVLIILLPIAIGPLLYSLFGPRNTK